MHKLSGFYDQTCGQEDSAKNINDNAGWHHTMDNSWQHTLLGIYAKWSKIINGINLIKTCLI